MAKVKPRGKKTRPPCSDEEMQQEAHALLAHTAAAWYCALHYPDAYVKERADEDLKTAIALLLREDMIRSHLRPRWMLGLAHAFRSSKHVQKQMREVFEKYPRKDDFRPSDVRLSEFPML